MGFCRMYFWEPRRRTRVIKACVRHHSKLSERCVPFPGSDTQQAHHLLTRGSYHTEMGVISWLITPSALTFQVLLFHARCPQPQGCPLPSPAGHSPVLIPAPALALLNNLEKHSQMPISQIPSPLSQFALTLLLLPELRVCSCKPL